MERAEEKQIENKRCCSCKNAVNGKNRNFAATSYKLLAKLTKSGNKHKSIYQNYIVSEIEIVDLDYRNNRCKKQEHNKAKQCNSYADCENISLVFVFIKRKAEASAVNLQKYDGNEHICRLLNKVGRTVVARAEHSCNIRHQQKAEYF